MIAKGSRDGYIEQPSAFFVFTSLLEEHAISFNENCSWHADIGSQASLMNVRLSLVVTKMLLESNLDFTRPKCNSGPNLRHFDIKTHKQVFISFMFLHRHFSDEIWPA